MPALDGSPRRAVTASLTALGHSFPSSPSLSHRERVHWSCLPPPGPGPHNQCTLTNSFLQHSSSFHFPTYLLPGLLPRLLPLTNSRPLLTAHCSLQLSPTTVSLPLLRAPCPSPKPAFPATPCGPYLNLFTYPLLYLTHLSTFLHPRSTLPSKLYNSLITQRRRAAVAPFALLCRRSNSSVRLFHPAPAVLFLRFTSPKSTPGSLAHRCLIFPHGLLPPSLAVPLDTSSS
ncbi:hypothetical protein EJ05DRAFT_7192 [Pseudovirgaria hyperparasitica]|uniref:Uncharacterized protein n=1 Tax=Pseudovirgaria hyperparasitica TaxID=470096 RepID=A0A6A6WKA8_9PEZI|nr:uncharacterized protein EJ05DRAFT_7192 [Pseudovirgaria hyperparasitica]KAF2762599.1 hypothetical protein EJ05DRAFT_7192 [Pseudovirgaria hyperparasitica]